MLLFWYIHCEAKKVVFCFKGLTLQWYTDGNIAFDIYIYITNDLYPGPNLVFIDTVLLD